MSERTEVGHNGGNKLFGSRTIVSMTGIHVDTVYDDKGDNKKHSIEILYSGRDKAEDDLVLQWIIRYKVNDETVFALAPNGTMMTFPDYRPDNAAKEFWQAVASTLKHAAETHPELAAFIRKNGSNSQPD